MPIFSGNVNDLIELIAYERDALEFVRSMLFGQTESTSQTLVFDLSHAKNAAGYYPATTNNVTSFAMSDQAVRSALSRLRPLAFSSAFKMHDMIAEWILRANGSTSWAFQRKIADYERLVSGRTLAEPLVLESWPVGSQAFWALYKALTPFRNQMIHGGGFSLTGSTLNISNRGVPLSLSDAEQSAYLRAIYLIADYILRNAPNEGVNAHAIENDLYTLRAIHGIAGLTARGVRIASVSVAAPGVADADGHVSVDVNFDEIKRQAEKVFPAGGGILAFDLTIGTKVANRHLKWVFPPFTAPTGQIRLTEGESQFEPYLAVG